MAYQKITLRSYAKINLGLHILGKREDGYHEIRTIFQSIDLHDRIEIERTREAGIKLECSSPELDGPNNLVWKAAQKMVDLLEVQSGLKIRLEKRIPPGAGLGGGSSNAATTLIGLQRLLEIELTRQQLFELGGCLGSDVPYFLVGGTALGVGRGSEVYPLEERDEKHILLAIPPFAVPTPNAYATASLTLTNRFNKSMIPVFCSGYLDSLSDLRLLENDFQQTLFEARAELREVKEELVCLGVRAVGLTGSGAALFGLFDSEQTLKKVQGSFSSGSIRMVRTQTLSRVQYWQNLVESLL